MVSPRKRGGSSRPSSVNTSPAKSVRFSNRVNVQDGTSSRSAQRPPTPGILKQSEYQSVQEQSTSYTSRRPGLRSASAAAAALAAQNAQESKSSGRHKYHRPIVEDEGGEQSTKVSETDYQPLIIWERDYASPRYVDTDSAILPFDGAGVEKRVPFEEERAPSSAFSAPLYFQPASSSTTGAPFYARPTKMTKQGLPAAMSAHPEGESKKGREGEYIVVNANKATGNASEDPEKGLYSGSSSRPSRISRSTETKESFSKPEDDRDIPKTPSLRQWLAENPKTASVVNARFAPHIVAPQLDTDLQAQRATLELDVGDLVSIVSGRACNHPGGTVPRHPTPETPAPMVQDSENENDIRGTVARIDAVHMQPIPEDFRSTTVFTRHHYKAMRRRRQLLETACSIENRETEEETLEERRSRNPDEAIMSPLRSLLQTSRAERRARRAQQKRDRQATTQAIDAKVARTANAANVVAKKNKSTSFWDRLFLRSTPKLIDNAIALNSGAVSRAPASGAAGGNPPDDFDSSGSSDEDGHGNSYRRRPAAKHNRRVARKRQKDMVRANANSDRDVFPVHPAGDYSDQAYDDVFYELYNKVYDFAERHFGPQYNLEHMLHPYTEEEVEITTSNKIKLWDTLSPEFIRWLEVIADGDPGRMASKDWSSLLLDSTERTAVVCAIISKILEIKVFGVLLFGGDDYQIAALEHAERGLIQNEGFTRTEIRSKTVRAMMGRFSTTEKFADKVEELTRQIFLLFGPLNTWLTHVPIAANTTRPERDEVSQFRELKTIINGAGFISLMVRRSPNIFHFVSANPGAYFDKEDHFSISGDFYNTSKKRLVENCNEDRAIYRLWAQNKTKQQLADIPYVVPQQRAMVKIGITPTIRIYKPGRDPKALPREREHLYSDEGFRIFMLRQAAILCQWGITNFEAYEHRPKENVEAYVKFLKNPLPIERKFRWPSWLTLGGIGGGISLFSTMKLLDVWNSWWPNGISREVMMSTTPSLIGLLSPETMAGTITTSLVSLTATPVSVGDTAMTTPP